MTVRVRPLVGEKNWELAQQRHRGLLRNILEQVRAIPGVDVAALVSGGVPLRGDWRTTEFAIPGRVLPPNEDLGFNQISPDYFRAMRVPLLKGRFFADDDRQGSEPVVIINDAAAQKYFPGEDPIGRTVQFLGVRRIVGVVGNIRHDGPETDWRRQGFVPLDQSRAVGATLMLRLSRDASDVLLLSLFGLLGIVIACVGIYGVMTYVVVLRTHEIGIRMALGAVPTAILWSVLGRALMYLGGGLAIGLPGAWVLGALRSGFLFQIQPHDTWVYACVSATLVATGVTAAFLPARRAARVDPLVALRLE